MTSLATEEPSAVMATQEFSRARTMTINSPGAVARGAGGVAAGWVAVATVPCFAGLGVAVETDDGAEVEFAGAGLEEDAAGLPLFVAGALLEAEFVLVGAG